MKKLFHPLISNLLSLILGLCFCLVAKSCPPFLQPLRLQPTRFLCLWDSPRKSIGVGCHFLLQGIFSIQGFNSPALQVDSLALNHLGSPGFFMSLTILGVLQPFMFHFQSRNDVGVDQFHSSESRRKSMEKYLEVETEKSIRSNFLFPSNV